MVKSLIATGKQGGFLPIYPAWNSYKAGMAIPLAQLTAINPDPSTCEAIKDWHYWVAQGYCF
jgi:hypothetical protein